MRLLITSRRFYQLEPLERRYFLSIVPIDATAGVPFEGLVATNLRLPAHATGIEMVNVMINGQWDYAPTAVAKADGTFDLYANMTVQRSGTETTIILFRNDLTGGWDVLETGQQTVKPNHFDARVPDSSIYNRIPGTLFRGAVTTFDTTPLTQPLEQYVVEVEGLGGTRQGRLVREADGSVGAYVDDTYLPVRDSAGDVRVTIRLASASPDAPDAGFARVALSVYPSIGIGVFYGAMTSDTGLRIHLPNEPKYAESVSHYFVPAAESDGWESTFTVNLIWNTGLDVQPTTPATLVRNPDGSYAIIAELPGGEIESPMMKIRETIHRPAVDGMPAETYTVEYVGSFDIVTRIPTDDPAPVVNPPAENGAGGETPTEPVPARFELGELGGSIDETRFTALASRESSASNSHGFDSVVTSLFSNSGGDEPSSDDDDDADEGPLPA
jgi:hypothetical protein